MPIQKVPLETLQKIRHHINSALALPDAENHPRSLSQDADLDLPEPDRLGELGSLFNFGGSTEFETHAPNVQGKWFISTINPGSALIKLTGVRLKPGLRLVAYLHRTGQDGAGAVWAIPESLSTTAQLEKALNGTSSTAQPPHPEGALADVMEALEGDRSPFSFLIASILRREINEFGALGKFCDWSHHRLITALPGQASWQWRANPPKDLSPKVLIYPDHKAAIEYFTCRVTSPVAIYQHIDQYQPTHYKPASVSRAIATPQPRT